MQRGAWRSAQQLRDGKRAGACVSEAAAGRPWPLACEQAAPACQTEHFGAFSTPPVPPLCNHMLPCPSGGAALHAMPRREARPSKPVGRAACSQRACAWHGDDGGGGSVAAQAGSSCSRRRTLPSSRPSPSAAPRDALPAGPAGRAKDSPAGMRSRSAPSAAAAARPCESARPHRVSELPSAPVGFSAWRQVPGPGRRPCARRGPRSWALFASP